MIMDGSRLKRARVAAGLSLRDLSDKIDNQVSAQAIGKYERGEMMPGSTVLIALARVLGVTESYLLSSAKLDLVSVDFRKKSTGSPRDEAALSAKIMAEVERYLAIEEILGLDGGAWQKPKAAPFPVRSMEEAEGAAGKLREAWSMGTDPIPNLAEFLEEQGVKIVTTPLPTAVSGMLCWVKRNGGPDIPVIILNSKDTGERQRFSLSHELGHLVMSVLQVDEEKACNRFAGAFLMVSDLLWREVGKHRRMLSMGELFQLKSLFGVSVQPIAYRCKDLGIIGDATMRQLFMAFTKYGWRSPPYAEPLSVRPEVPQRFRRLCLRALAEQTVSESRAAELMSMTVRDLNNLMDQPPEG